LGDVFAACVVPDIHSDNTLQLQVVD